MIRQLVLLLLYTLLVLRPVCGQLEGSGKQSGDESIFEDEQGFAAQLKVVPGVGDIVVDDNGEIPPFGGEGGMQLRQPGIFHVSVTQLNITTPAQRMLITFEVDLAATETHHGVIIAVFNTSTTQFTGNLEITTNEMEAPYYMSLQNLQDARGILPILKGCILKISLDAPFVLSHVETAGLVWPDSGKRRSKESTLKLLHLPRKRPRGTTRTAKQMTVFPAMTIGWFAWLVIFRGLG